MDVQENLSMQLKIAYTYIHAYELDQVHVNTPLL
jgi:hypothetical protein